MLPLNVSVIVIVLLKFLVQILQQTLKINFTGYFLQNS